MYHWWLARTEDLCLHMGSSFTKSWEESRGTKSIHLDEVYLKINGKTHDLWRVVDQDGNVLDILVQSRRNKQAAKKFFRKLLKGLEYVPRVIITDKLASYAAASLQAHTHQWIGTYGGAGNGDYRGEPRRGYCQRKNFCC
jgi:transposase-like protein